ncbi:uncharacterized protein LOC129762996 [Toxorhynchites rutilus septentrionalis]|uniref:uncharacterized protein LOC129762996 n=1 Tax=Toxorhynchites rutilus septentrionalis TaxID=329112 RepID=UPI0024786448|nr:uncharacterized protein LOC129762996 [Toxorhynchites rutilus septentrionalis]
MDGENSSCYSQTEEDDEQQMQDPMEGRSYRDPEGQLLQTVRSCLEQKNYLRKVRSEMRQKVLETIQIPAEGTESLFLGSGGGDDQPPKAVLLINQMILEYLEWYNLQYSAEMFSAETGTAPMERTYRRQKLQSTLSATLEDPLEFQSNLPVLAELVMKLAAAVPGGSAD